MHNPKCPFYHDDDYIIFDPIFEVMLEAVKFSEDLDEEIPVFQTVDEYYEFYFLIAEKLDAFK